MEQCPAGMGCWKKHFLRVPQPTLVWLKWCLGLSHPAPNVFTSRAVPARDLLEIAPGFAPSVTFPFYRQGKKKKKNQQIPPKHINAKITHAARTERSSKAFKHLYSDANAAATIREGSVPQLLLDPAVGLRLPKNETAVLRSNRSTSLCPGARLFLFYSRADLFPSAEQGEHCSPVCISGIEAVTRVRASLGKREKNLC